MNAHKKAIQFYYDNAGYSYNPKTETKEQGRIRCAKTLADAAVWATDEGIEFLWDMDIDMDSSEWTDEQPPWATYNCTALNWKGEAVAHICGCDFGRDGNPHTDSYARVIQAELAAEIKGND